METRESMGNDFNCSSVKYISAMTLLYIIAKDCAIVEKPLLNCWKNEEIYVIQVDLWLFSIVIHRKYQKTQPNRKKSHVFAKSFPHNFFIKLF